MKNITHKNLYLECLSRATGCRFFLFYNIMNWINTGKELINLAASAGIKIKP